MVRSSATSGCANSLRSAGVRAARKGTAIRFPRVEAVLLPQERGRRRVWPSGGKLRGLFDAPSYPCLSTLSRLSPPPPAIHPSTQSFIPVDPILNQVPLGQPVEEKVVG